MSSVVLDASALIAFLRREPGGEQVREVLSSTLISTVNLSEVLTKAAETPHSYEAAKQVLRELPMRVIPFDEQQAGTAAGLRMMTRELGLSLGDRCCLALALCEKLPVLTTDQQWAKLALNIPVRVLR